MNNKMKAFSCECVGGFTGLLCDNNIDYCSPNPCKNDGSCTNLEDSSFFFFFSDFLSFISKLIKYDSFFVQLYWNRF